MSLKECNMDFSKIFLAAGLTVSLAAGTSFAAKYEAEEATLSGGAEAVSSDKASGGKYVNENEGDIEFKVTATAAGKHMVKIHYKSGAFKSNYIAVNGQTAGQVDFNEAIDFTDITTIVTLKAGENTITIQKFWGWISVDYIDVEPYESQPFAICNTPVTPNATESAVKLYNFLVNNFEKQTISGVMTGDMEGFTDGGDAKSHPDVADVYTRSGKYPALVGVDFLFATGPKASESWYKSYTDKAISLAKSLWKQGGIPAFTWHWKDPLDEKDAFYANAEAAGDGEWTDFDFTKAFMTGTTTWDTLSAAYKGIIADIDYIADYFLDLQKDGVAAIFRPLHEAGGNWFWWSTKTGKQFAALYRLVYERMVFTKGVKNLVWVFNPSSTGNTEWNPGETYYDVLSIDIYNNDNDHSSNSGAFDDFKTKWGLSKILALSENGPIPDVENMKTDGAVWSWWMPWYGTWGGKYIGQTKNEVWKSNMESDRVITLDEMPGWDKYTEANSGTGTCKESSQETKFNGDTAKAAGEVTEDKMLVTLTNVGDDGILLSYTKLPDLTNSKTISVDITVEGEGATEGGVWVGLAFTRDGSKDSLWTWEQSPSDGCWLEQSASTTCKFAITSYVDDNKEEHPMDIGNLFSVAFVISTPGFSGKVTFDNMVTDDGKIVSLFDDSKSLFTSDKKNGTTAKVSLASESSDAIKTIATATSSKLTVQASVLSFITRHAGFASVDVFNLNGKRVATLYRGNLNAGSYAFSLANLSAGQYIIRVKGAGLMATQPVRIK